MNWQEDILMGGFALLMAALVYAVIHMLINRVKGRDELHGLFAVRLKRNKKQTSKPKY